MYIYIYVCIYIYIYIMCFKLIQKRNALTKHKTASAMVSFNTETLNSGANPPL